MIHHGDCVEVMAQMAENSVDAIVCDPPYDLTADRAGWRGKSGNDFNKRPDLALKRGGFMNKSWDGTGVAFRVETWAAAYRVAKPGAYLLAFGGTRTSHRLACAIEDAGWIIRDTLVWAYASGFPKSKATLKPAWEPIVMARKPGPLRELAIDACRIEAAPTKGDGWRPNSHGTVYGDNSAVYVPGKGLGEKAYNGERHPAGRWPANIILTDPIFDGGWDGVVGGGEASAGSGWAGAKPSETELFTGVGGVAKENYQDTGTYSRFFSLPRTIGSCQYCGVPSAGSSSEDRTTPATPSGTAPEPASSPRNSSPRSRAPSAALPSDVPGSSTAPPSARLWAGEGDESNRAGQTTSDTESGSSRRPEPTTPPTPRSKPLATSPRSTSPSVPATTAAPSETSSDTTTTTPSRWTCEFCAALVTAESTPDAMSDGRKDSPEVPAGQPDYARFYLVPKASRSDREPNDYGKLVGGLEPKRWSDGRKDKNKDYPSLRGATDRANSHPTVKPVELMRHLVRLVTPQGGTVLDPFLGSGTTAVAAEQEGFAWIGIEREAEYIAIAEARLAGAQRGLGLDVPAPTKKRVLPSDEKLAELGKTYPGKPFMEDLRKQDRGDAA